MDWQHEIERKTSTVDKLSGQCSHPKTSYYLMFDQTFNPNRKTHATSASSLYFFFEKTTSLVSHLLNNISQFNIYQGLKC